MTPIPSGREWQGGTCHARIGPSDLSRVGPASQMHAGAELALRLDVQGLVHELDVRPSRQHVDAAVWRTKRVPAESSKAQSPGLVLSPFYIIRSCNAVNADKASLPERLRGLTRNQIGSACAGSSPAGCALFSPPPFSRRPARANQLLWLPLPREGCASGCTRSKPEVFSASGQSEPATVSASPPRDVLGAGTKRLPSCARRDERKVMRHV